jgi:hypothetical protein
MLACRTGPGHRIWRWQNQMYRSIAIGYHNYGDPWKEQRYDGD